MTALPGSALCALALILAASPACADAALAVCHRPALNRLTVHARREPGPRPAAAMLGVAVAPGLVFETPFTLVAGVPDALVRVPHYIGPDGTYDSQADLVRSINGTPCGQACTRRSLRRWGYAPAD